MLPLVLHVVVLEPEVKPQPVQQVVVRVPRHEPRFLEVPGGAQGSRSCSYLRVPQRRVVHQEVVDGDDVVHVPFRRSRWRVEDAAPATERRWLPSVHGGLTVLSLKLFLFPPQVFCFHLR